ncbi:PIN domain-containing protein [Parasediminibacterium sp. JCM 36343]|uniref:PIN domain-containing protein n=1 Tax=Parasediminibacterium sp. JCM 36343 TaxID=3374279 RepID=UPI00397D1E32
MSVNVFFDTNVLVYTYSNNELAKQAIARKLVLENNAFISTQVLQELVNTVTRKLKFPYTYAIAAVNECVTNYKLHINTNNTIANACNIAHQYKTSFYDSLIIAAALESNCTILYSEDMHDRLIIDGTLTIMNPFK